MNTATSAMVICILTEIAVKVNLFLLSTGSRIAILPFVERRIVIVG